MKFTDIGNDQKFNFFKGTSHCKEKYVTLLHKIVGSLGSSILLSNLTDITGITLH